MDAPKISIVTPSYNQAPFLEATMRSVLLQRYPNLEYIVNDGNSTDGSQAIIEKYSDHLAFWRSQKDDGHAAAVHDGLERATGDILGFLNSDDVLMPGALETVVRAFRDQPSIDVIYSNRLIIDAGGIVRGYWILPPHLNYLMRRWDLIPQETCFWRRRIMDQAGSIDPTIRFALDYDLFVRFMKAGRFRRIRTFLGSFRVHDNAKTTRDLASIGQADIDRIQEKYNIRVREAERLVGHGFSAFVQWRSARLAAQAADCRTGKLASVPRPGCSIDELWGGMLSEHRVPQKTDIASPGHS